MKGVVILSIMPVGKTKEERIKEIKYILSALQTHLRNFVAKVIVQVNVSCPNTGEELDVYLQEVSEWVVLLRTLGVPLTVKISALTPYEAAVRLAEQFDAIFAINTLPYDSLTKEEKDKYFYGAKESPLMKYQDEFNVKGAGGASGAVLLQRGLTYTRELRNRGVTIPIILGGGILKPEDVDAAKAAGADAISPGSITMLRPWNLHKVIQRAEEIFD
jgi:dihydroorotate dehydrogenase